MAFTNLHQIHEQAIHFLVIAIRLHQSGRVNLAQCPLQAFDIPCQGGHIHFLAGHADDRHGLRHLTDIASANGVKELGHAVPGFTANSTDDPEVDESDPTVLQ